MKSFFQSKEVALETAKHLLQIKAVRLQPQKPFNWASGWKSPIYCDNRVTLSYPVVRTHIRQEMVNSISQNFAQPDVIVGVATGGIAMGVLVAQELGLPFAYVRSSSKGHGMQNAIEGIVDKGHAVVVIEDLISTGNSSLNAVQKLKEAGADIKGMVAIFSYDFPIVNENFKKHKCKLVTLSGYLPLLEKAVDLDYITEKDVTTLKKWRESPDTWGK